MSESHQALPADETQTQYRPLPKSTDPATPRPKPLPRTRHGSRNQHRHKHFVKWLLQTFPQQLSSSSSPSSGPILDIAGGKGEVSARLTICHNLDVIMIDPRTADVSKCFLERVLPKLPNKWRDRINNKLKHDDEFVTKIVNAKFRQLEMNFDQDIVENRPELRLRIEEAPLMIGMHADAATEAIVDVAIQFRKPFVVVPCCVFPNLFRSRVLVEDDGRSVPVRSYEQFCRYLAQKDERLVMEKIPIEGRNVAIWWDGQDGNEDGNVT